MSKMSDLLIEIEELLRDGMEPHEVAQRLGVSEDFVAPAYNYLLYGDLTYDSDNDVLGGENV